ncbi:hypothetical protein A6R68_15661, partial [Neotoma lepida]
EYTQNKKEAERVIKNLIKTVIKLAVLPRNNQFHQDDVALMEMFMKKVQQLAMTVVGFHHVEYTFHCNMLSRLLNECRELLHDIVQREPPHHQVPRTELSVQAVVRLCSSTMDGPPCPGYYNGS